MNKINMYYSTTSISVNYWSAPCMKVIHNVTPESVIAAACDAFKVTIDELLSNSRRALIVRVRNICYHILRKKTNLSLEMIGKAFNRDHTTVMHGLKCVKDNLSVAAYRQQMNEDLRAVMEMI